MVIKNIEKIELQTWHRNQLLQCAHISLSAYKEFKDDEFMMYTNWFMEQSKELRNATQR